MKMGLAGYRAAPGDSGAEIKCCLAHFSTVFTTFQLNLPITNVITWSSLRKTSVTLEAPAADLPRYVRCSAQWRAAAKLQPEQVNSATCSKDFPGKNVTHSK